MVEHRFYVADAALPAPGAELSLTGEVAHRITRVLRMRRGEPLALFARGQELECELIEAGSPARVRVLAELPPEPQRIELNLYQALIRLNRFEWLIEKVTEIGVTAIVPIITERATVRANEVGATRLERWRRIAIEASEQSGRRSVPSIATPVSYAAALSSATGCKVFAWEGLRRPAGTRIQPDPRGLSLFIGPEGGWSDEEVERARAAGAAFMALGRNTLRSETAAIAAATLLLLD